LALVVGPRGQLSAVRIVRSSGYDILDQAAVEALNRLRQVPEAAAILNGTVLSLVLPVRYRLVSS
jgi:TonB family protein